MRQACAPGVCARSARARVQRLDRLRLQCPLDWQQLHPHPPTAYPAVACAQQIGGPEHVLCRGCGNRHSGQGGAAAWGLCSGGGAPLQVLYLLVDARQVLVSECRRRLRVAPAPVRSRTAEPTPTAAGLFVVLLLPRKQAVRFGTERAAAAAARAAATVAVAAEHALLDILRCGRRGKW